MRENLMNKSHKTTTQAYRDGWDRTFGKTRVPLLPTTDVTLCQPTDCPSKESCLRYLSLGDPKYQSYSDSATSSRPLRDKCAYYMPVDIYEGTTRGA